MSGTIEDFVKTLKEGSEPWLLLFDIDGTLVDIGGEGMAALRENAGEVFRPGLVITTRIEPGICSGMQNMLLTWL